MPKLLLQGLRDTEILTGGLLPMLIPLILVPEATRACPTPCVFRRGLKVVFELHSRAETLQASEADVLMAHGVVVLEMVLETPFVVECAEAQVAVELMTVRVFPAVDVSTGSVFVLHAPQSSHVLVVLQAVTVFEDAFAKVAVVLVINCSLFDMCQESRLAGELLGANSAPVLVRIVCRLAVLHSRC
jgi:hypothetical protein